MSQFSSLLTKFGVHYRTSIQDTITGFHRKSECNSQWTIITHLEHCKFHCSLVFWELFIFLIIKFVFNWWDHFSEWYVVMHFQRTWEVQELHLAATCSGYICWYRSIAKSYLCVGHINAMILLNEVAYRSLWLVPLSFLAVYFEVVSLLRSMRFLHNAE